MYDGLEKLFDGFSDIKELLNKLADLHHCLANIDYLLKSKSTYSSEINEQQNAIERMKVIALESGIIKL